ncbi:MAG: nuclear transport factor 2 family protein [bacterium]|nr:nuclear transport factor 2 family protein [bacterium]
MTPVVATSESDAKEDLTEQLRQAETTFAATMAERDFEAFQEFLAEEAVFFNGETELRGRQAVAAAWKTLFEDSDAPFSWRPEVVSVLDSGTLGLSSGPVLDPQGNRVGTFLSLWRREANGQWRIVFDRECPWCALD